MLAAIRKFSSSIYSKIFLLIVAIPFIFWGMGPLFTGGNTNIIVVIDNEKYSTQSFIEFIQKYAPIDQKINVDQIEELLSFFIGEQLIISEIEYFSIKLSNNSLSKLIKLQEEFKRNNEFSRIEYEKFLLKNNLNAVSFENNLSQTEKKKQLMNFIGGGVLPSKFLVDNSYDKINQKRYIQFIDLNNIFDKELNFSDEQINSYYKKNENKYQQIYKHIKILELSPKTLIDNDEFDELFFRKIDEIDDLIVQGENMDYIKLKFNLEKVNTFTLNELGEDLNSKKLNNFQEDLIKNIFAISDDEPIALIESKDKYFVVEIVKSENIKKKVTNEKVRKNILLNLKMESKRKVIAKIMSKISAKSFTKSDFDKLSNDKKLIINKLSLKNKNDNKIFKEELVNQIYSFPEKKIILAHDIGLTENFLIYIDKVEHTSIDNETDEYKKYLNLSKIEITSRLLNTYDNYIKERYKIDINYKALETVKNYFN